MSERSDAAVEERVRDPTIVRSINAPSDADVRTTSYILFSLAITHVCQKLEPRIPNFVGMKDRAADKVIRYVGRAWDARDEIAPDTVSGTLRRLPIDDQAGIHGPRSVLNLGPPPLKGQDPPPLLDEMAAYYKPFPDSHKLIEMNEVRIAGAHGRRFRGLTTDAKLAEVFLIDLVKPEDVRFTTELAIALGELEQDQIIAIGRHESAYGTREAILYEMERWLRSVRDLRKTLRRYERDGDLAKLRTALPQRAWKVWSLSWECELKGGVERTNYETARATLLSAATPQLQPVFERLSCPAVAIWDDPSVTSLRLPCHAIYRASTCLIGALRRNPTLADYFGRPRVSEEQAEEAHVWCSQFVRNDKTTFPGYWEPPDPPPATLDGPLLPSFEHLMAPFDQGIAIAVSESLNSLTDTIDSAFIFPYTGGHLFHEEMRKDEEGDEDEEDGEEEGHP